MLILSCLYLSMIFKTSNVVLTFIRVTLNGASSRGGRKRRKEGRKECGRERGREGFFESADFDCSWRFQSSRSNLARLSRRSRSTIPLLVCEGTIALCCVLPVEKHHTIFCSFIAFFVLLYFSNSTRQIMVIKMKSLSLEFFLP